jgi:hypothetical protein
VKNGYSLSIVTIEHFILSPIRIKGNGKRDDPFENGAKFVKVPDAAIQCLPHWLKGISSDVCSGKQSVL